MLQNHKYLYLKLPCQSELGNNVSDFCQESNSHLQCFFSPNVGSRKAILGSKSFPLNGHFISTTEGSEQ